MSEARRSPRIWARRPEAGEELCVGAEVVFGLHFDVESQLFVQFALEASAP
jgi:hypothetical protein